MSEQAVKTVRIHGNDYVTVDERVRLVTERDGGFDTISARQYELNGRYFYEVTIRVGGDHTYIGTSEIRFGGTGIDKNSPMENAETSAIGRALGFANVGNVGGIASADEVQGTPQAAPSLKLTQERAGKLTKLIHKALIDQGADASYADWWIGAMLRRADRDALTDLTPEEGAALLSAASKADMTEGQR